MKSFFKLKHSVEIPEVGTQPQIQTSWPGPTDYWAPDSYTNTPLKGKIDFVIVFPEFEIDELAKLTDWVGAVNINRNYLMISTRFYELLKAFQMDEYQHFPAPVKTPGGMVDYHLIYFPYPRGDDFINWEKSLFKRVTPDGRHSVISFANSKERQLASDAHEIQTEKIVVRWEKVTMDIFRFRAFEAGFYVSEQLKQAMENRGMTGIRYEKTSWLEQAL